MGPLNLSDAKTLKDYWDNNPDELVSNLEAYGVDVSGSRTIGTYMGVSGDVLGVEGAEVQLAYAMIRSQTKAPPIVALRVRSDEKS